VGGELFSQSRVSFIAVVVVCVLAEDGKDEFIEWVQASDFDGAVFFRKSVFERADSSRVCVRSGDERGKLFS